jgi:Zn-dependent protease with chaperone function
MVERMFILLGISILLAALLGFNSLASLFTAALWRIAGGFTRHWTAVTQARVLFWLRVLPTGLGAVCVLILVAPAYLELEPRTTTEGVSLKLGIIAFASGLGIALAVVRSIAAWRATARLRADWLAHAEQISIPEAGIAAYRLEHQFPVIAIVGVWHPRLFVGRKIFDSLTAAEIAAAVAHETGHLAARDNLKRAFVRACRDLMLIVPCGRALDSAWIEASEAAADEHAARQGPAVALDLAAALVKISRLIPVGSRPALPAGAFLVHDEESLGVKARVRRLIQIASGESPLEVHEPLSASLVAWTSLGFLALLVAMTRTNPQVLATVHSLIERVVSFLS